MRASVLALSALGLAASLGATGCARSVAERGTGWWRVTTDHVQLDTDVAPDRAVTAGWAFEDDYRALAHVFPRCQAPEIAERVEVTMIARGEEYDHFAPANTAGFFRSAREAIVAEEPILVVRNGSGIAASYFRQIYVHELTHRFVARCFPEAPPWLHEGMARFFETMQVGGEDVTVGISPYHVVATAEYPVPFLASGLQIVQIGRDRMARPSTLVAMPDATFYAATTTAWNYASAWALVHLLSLGQDTDLRDRFTRYLEGTTSHGADPGWFARVFGDVPLDAAFDAYLGTAHLQRHVPYAAPPLADPPASALGSGEAHLRLATFSARRGDPDIRREVLAHVALAADDPRTLPRARLLALELGEVEAGVTKAAFLADLAERFEGDLDVLSTCALFEVARGSPTNRGRELLDTLRARGDLRAIDRARLADLAMLHREYAASLELGRRAVALSPSSSIAHSALARALWQHSYRTESAAERRLAQLTAGHGAPPIDEAGTDDWIDASASEAEDAAVPTPTPLPEAPDATGALLRLHAESGTPIRASTLDPRCIGFVGAPIAQIEIPPGGARLVIRTQSVFDTVLAIEDAEHHVHCDDDSGGATSSAVYASFPAGALLVRVGTFHPASRVIGYDVVVEPGDTALEVGSVPRSCGMSAPAYGSLVVGTRVVVGRHTALAPGADGVTDEVRDPIALLNWSPAMEAFVGREAHVVELMPLDAAGCPVVRVDVDDRTWLWRIRDLWAPTSS